MGTNEISKVKNKLKSCKQCKLVNNIFNAWKLSSLTGLRSVEQFPVDKNYLAGVYFILARVGVVRYSGLYVRLSVCGS